MEKSPWSKQLQATYIAGQTRAAQENMQMVKAILSSLTLSGYSKVQAWSSQWTIAGHPAAFPLIKIIIREAYIDTHATARILREKLSSLPEKLHELGGDISQLNAFVMVTTSQLAARGETTNDLLANLFKGYLSSTDRTFVTYIEKKQEDHDEGKLSNTTELMSLASNKYKTLVENGKWMAPSKEEQKIIALEAKLDNFKRSAQSKFPSKPKDSNKDSNKGKNKGKGKPSSSEGQIG